MAILILEKADFKTKTITRDKEGHFIKPNSSERPNNHKLYVPNNRASKYMRQKLTELREKQIIPQS